MNWQYIKYVRIKDFKGIKELEVDNLSRFVAVFWQNWAGKSSFIEAIQNAIKLTHGGNSKVRFWEDQGEIEIHFEDFSINRIIGSKGKLEVIYQWNKLATPQKYLDDIFQGIIGDPQKFIDLWNKDKVRYILDTQWKTAEYEALETQRSKAFDERTDLRRVALAKENEAKENDVEWIEQPKAIWSMEDLQKELEDANNHNSNLINLKNTKTTLEQKIQYWENNLNNISQKKIENNEKIKQLQQQIQLLEEENIMLNNSSTTEQTSIDDSKKSLDVINKDIEKFVIIDTQEIQNKISERSENNKELANYNAKKEIYQKISQDAIKYRDEWRVKDEEVKAIEEKQNKLLETINLSYKIRSIDWQILVSQKEQERIPLDELNTATQLDIWIELCLSSPNKIKIITIENANSLDPLALAKIKAKIEENEAQCFLETVYKTWYESITIQDWELLTE